MAKVPNHKKPFEFQVFEVSLDNKIQKLHDATEKIEKDIRNSRHRSTNSMGEGNIKVQKIIADASVASMNPREWANIPPPLVETLNGFQLLIGKTMIDAFNNLDKDFVNGFTCADRRYKYHEDKINKNTLSLFNRINECYKNA